MSITIGRVVKPKDKEKSVEQYLIKQIAKLGGNAYKFNSDQRVGVPDRICVLPNRVLVFVECKRPGKEPTATQWRELGRLRDLDQLATWVSTKEEVDFLINRIKPTHPFLSSDTLREDHR